VNTHGGDASLDDAIGQCVMVGFQGTVPPPGLIELIERERVGGVILFARNCRGGPAQVRALTARLQAIARAAGHVQPLLIAMDQENGVVRRLGSGATEFPGGMGLGAAGDPDLTAAVARASAEELRALGINLNLAPVADINNNPANPVIGVRAFGDDPAVVARHVAAAVRGYIAGGMIATLKHFPGHGDTGTDSHTGLPLITHDRARLEAAELLPFRAGHGAGAECVLTAHLALPRLTGGRIVPASLAPEIVRGLLREGLGFNGVAITDCLEMGAIARGEGIPAAAIAALRAGNDIVLISHRDDRQRAALSALHAALAQGTLAIETVRAAAARVLRLKQRLGVSALHGSVGATAVAAPHSAAEIDASEGRAGASVLPGEDDWQRVVGSAAHRALSAHAYARGVTLVRDSERQLPLRLAPDARLFVVAAIGQASKAVDLAYRPETITDALRGYHSAVSLVTVSAAPEAGERQSLLARAAAAEVTLLLSFNARRDPAQATLLRALAAAARHAILLAVADPYDATALPEVPTVLATYDYAAPALAAAAHALFADGAPPGRLPVALGA
jgi:beta-N-acetylhexosaminidase